MHDEDDEEALGMSPRQLTRLAAVHDESLEIFIMSPAQLQKEAASRKRTLREGAPDVLHRRAAQKRQSRGNSNEARFNFCYVLYVSLISWAFPLFCVIYYV
jgi:hypothetical protein